MTPVSGHLGTMPAFGNSLNDDQIGELVAYLRQRFAPDKSSWTDVAGAIGRARNPPAR